MRKVMHWARKHPLVATASAVVAFYFVPNHIYYCYTEGCIAPGNWWFHLDPNTQATWLAAIAGVAVVMKTREAIDAALAVPEKEAALRKRETDELNRVRAHAIAMRLFYSIALLSQRIQEVKRILERTAREREPRVIMEALSGLEIASPDVLLAAFQSPELFSQARLERLVTLVTSIESFNRTAANRYVHIKSWNEAAWPLFIEGGRLGMGGVLSTPIAAAKRLEDGSNEFQMEVLKMIEETKRPVGSS